MAAETETGLLSDKQERARDEILDSFNEYDANRDGYISLKEAHSVLETKLGLQLDQTKKLMRMCNCKKTGNEQLSRDEFADFFLMVTEQMEELRSIFNTIDLDQDGSITFDEAKIALRELGFLDLEIEQLVKTHDSNNDGRLQFEEFVKMWNG